MAAEAEVVEIIALPQTGPIQVSDSERTLCSWRAFLSWGQEEDGAHMLWKGLWHW